MQRWIYEWILSNFYYLHYIEGYKYKKKIHCNKGFMELLIVIVSFAILVTAIIKLWFIMN